MLTISIFQGSQPCRLVWEGHQQHVELQQLHQYFTKDYVKSSHRPLGGNMDPWYLWSWFFESIDPWFMYSSNLWSTSLCAARAVDHRSKLDTTNFTTLHLGDQSSKISVLANYLVTKHRYICMKFATTVIWWRKTSESDLFCIFP